MLEVRCAELTRQNHDLQQELEEQKQHTAKTDQWIALTSGNGDESMKHRMMQAAMAEVREKDAIIQHMKLQMAQMQECSRKQHSRIEDLQHTIAEMEHTAAEMDVQNASILASIQCGPNGESHVRRLLPSLQWAGLHARCPDNDYEGRIPAREGGY